MMNDLRKLDTPEGINEVLDMAVAHFEPLKRSFDLTAEDINKDRDILSAFGKLGNGQGIR